MADMSRSRPEVTESDRWAITLGAGSLGALPGAVIGALIAPDAVLPLGGLVAVVAPLLMFLRLYVRKAPLPSRPLDRRRSVLRDFLNDCEGRIAPLENVGRDYEEVQRFRSLAGGSDDLLAEADESVGRIAAGVLVEAQRVAEALGAAEMERLKKAAAEVPLDRIEEGADQILEHSTREDHELQAPVERLSDTVWQTGSIAGDGNEGTSRGMPGHRP